MVAIRAHTAVLLAIGLAFGCSTKNADTSEDASEDGGDGGSEAGDGADGADGDGGGEDGGPGDDPNAVDCATLEPNDGTIGPGSPGPLGFPTRHCNPRRSGAAAHFCCSDDPAAPGGALPAYAGYDVTGATPLFADVNNGRSTSGMCVRQADIPPGSGLLDANAENCPIPCNPTWDASSVSEVCGFERSCCQTRALQEPDCIMGPDGTWRPATGKDVPDLTNWGPNVHPTAQDPTGAGCQDAAQGDQDAFDDCIDQLTVANARGYCMLLPPGSACPTTDPQYLDACELLNMGY